MQKNRAIVSVIQIVIAVVGTMLLWKSMPFLEGVAYIVAALGLLALAAFSVYVFIKMQSRGKWDD